MKQNRKSLRGEDRCKWAGGQTDKGKRHLGMEEKKKVSDRGGDKVNDGVGASVTGLTRDST